MKCVKLTWLIGVIWILICGCADDNTSSENDVSDDQSSADTTPDNNDETNDDDSDGDENGTDDPSGDTADTADEIDSADTDAIPDDTAGKTPCTYTCLSADICDDLTGTVHTDMICQGGFGGGDPVCCETGMEDTDFMADTDFMVDNCDYDCVNIQECNTEAGDVLHVDQRCGGWGQFCCEKSID